MVEAPTVVDRALGSTTRGRISGTDCLGSVVPIASQSLSLLYSFANNANPKGNKKEKQKAAA